MTTPDTLPRSALPWLDALPDPLLLVSPGDGREVRYANPAAAQYLGRDAQGQALADLWPELASHLPALDALPQTVRLRASGPWAWVDVRAFAVGDLVALQLSDATVPHLAELRAGALFDLTVALSRALTVQEASDVVLRQSLAALDAVSGNVLVQDEADGHLVLVGSVGYGAASLEGWRRFPREATPVLAEVLDTGKPQFLSTTEADARNAHVRVERTAPTRTLAVLPLCFDGRAVGVMTFGFARDDLPAPPERHFLFSLAEELAQALERARLFAGERRARETAALLYELTAALGGATTPGEVAQVIARTSAPALGATGGAVMQLDEAHEELVLLSVHGYEEARSAGWGRFSLHLDVIGAECARTREAIFLGTPEYLDRYPHRRGQTPTEAAAALPLWADGRLLGVLSYGWDEPHVFTSAERELLLALAGQCAQALERTVRAEVQRAQAQLLDLAQDAVIVRTADSEVTHWNPAAEALYGYTIQEARGQITHDLLQTRFPVSREALDEALLAGGVWEGELRHTARDGREVIVASRQSLRRNERGEPVAILEVNRDVTAKRAAQAALVVGEERYRALIEATDQYVWTNSPEGEMVGEQPGWARLTGQTQEEYQGYGWSERLHPDDREHAVEAWHESVRTRSLYEVEQRVRVQGGTYRSFLVRAVPLLGEDGRLREWVGLHSDVTDLKRAELMLKAWSSELERQVAARTEELRAQSLALAAFAAFTEAVGSREGQRDLARQACEVLHATFEDGTAVYYEPDGDLWRGVAWAGDLPEATLALVQQGLPGNTTGIARSVEARDAVFIDGWRGVEDDTARQTREYGTAAFFPVMVGGEVVGLLTAGLKSRSRWDAGDQAVVRGVGRGLTLAAERAVSVRALREQQEVVEARNRALEGFAVLAHDLAFETDPLVLVRRAQEIVLDLLPEGFGLYYRPEGEVWRLRVQTGDMRNDELQAAVDAGLPLEEARNLWLPYHSGEAYYQDRYDTGTDGLGDLTSGVGATACLPVRADNSVVGVLAVGLFGAHRWSQVDHALLETAVLMLELAFERSQVARQLAEQQAQLRAANEELGAFAYTVSHDLRAPVRHVGSFASLLRKKIGDNPGLLRYVDQIEGAATRMETLTDALLGLARAGAAQLDKTDVNLGALVEAVRSDLAPDHAGRHVTWRIGLLPTVRADVGLLRQVLANLLGNAVKYSREREEAVVEVWAEETPNEVTIAVRDNGAGFDPQYAGKLFGVFQRLHHQSEFEGTGIGLANVRRIVEKHGGRVWASARPGEGATFFVSLPWT